MEEETPTTVTKVSTPNFYHLNISLKDRDGEAQRPYNFFPVLYHVIDGQTLKVVLTESIVEIPWSQVERIKRNEKDSDYVTEYVMEEYKPVLSLCMVKSTYL